MSAKTFTFTVEDLRTKARGEAAATHATLAGAFALAAKELPAALHADYYGPFPGPQCWVRLFHIRFVNTRTGEAAGFIGQGESVAEAFSDGVKGTADTFRPKNDGKARPQFGLWVQQPPRIGDTEAVCSTVSRSIASFESDETMAEEAARLAREAEAKAAANQGRAA